MTDFSRLVTGNIIDRPPISNLRVVLFDFDGTLVNTTPLILQSFRATWENLFGFSFDDQIYIKTFGMLIHTGLKQLIQLSAMEGRINLPDDLDKKAQEVLQVYRAFNLKWHDEMIEPVENIVDVLQELSSRNFGLGIVSSKIRAGVDRGLNLYELAEFFDVIVSAEDVGNHKPHPEPLLRAMEKFEVTPGETIYVGDSIHDIAAGRAAKTFTAAATWGPFPRNELEREMPDYLLEEPGELLRIIGS